MATPVVRLFSMLALAFTFENATADPSCLPPPTLSEANYDVTPEAEKNVCLRRTINRAADHHMLVFSWSPGFCRSAAANGKLPEHLGFQCRQNKFGWVVHGLWAELDKPETCIADPKQPEARTNLHPRYCQGNLPQLPAELVKTTMCTMPGARLIQGQWEKHGACTFERAEDYFAKIKDLRDQLKLPPDMMPQTQLFKWMREHNPHLSGLSLDYSGKRNELYVCFSTGWKPISCPHTPPAVAGLRVRRGARLNLAQIPNAPLPSAKVEE